ncbi:MAG: transposase [Sporichthyaceae bacterium]
MTHTSVDAAHGGIETRSLQVVEVKRGIGFPHAKPALRIRRERKFPDGKRTNETVLAITDLTWHQITPGQLAEAVRAHWGTENRPHWVRDVTFGEDHSQVRTGNAPTAMAGLRIFAIALHRRHGTPNIAQGCRTLSRHPARVSLEGSRGGRLTSGYATRCSSRPCWRPTPLCGTPLRPGRW